jgi:hypothetical protein
VNVDFHDPQPTTETQRQKAVYARSAYRNDPEFEFRTLSAVPTALKEYRIGRLIENDQAVSLNYARLVSQTSPMNPATSKSTPGRFPAPEENSKSRLVGARKFAGGATARRFFSFRLMEN